MSTRRGGDSQAKSTMTTAMAVAPEGTAVEVWDGNLPVTYISVREHKGWVAMSP